MYNSNLLNLSDIGYTATFIAKLSGISLRTVRRMMSDHRLTSKNMSYMGDIELDNRVRQIMELDIGMGRKMIAV